jgi:predicted phosphodiesterase
MAIVRFIGDVHGKIGEYLYITDNCDMSIQVGDLGAGFVPLPTTLSVKHRNIRGNHDSPQALQSYPNWIPDGKVEIIDETKIMFMGGAFSIDRYRRIEGVSWWADEECTIEQFYSFMDIVQKEQPDIIVTHDCPKAIVNAMFGVRSHHYETTRTNQALDAIFQIHRPKMWVFGHHHINSRKNILGTDFICLGELAYIDVAL